MFSNLIESTANPQQNTKRQFYFVATLFLNTAVFLGIFVWSIYSFNVSAFGHEDLTIETLVAPAVLPADAPPPEIKQAAKTAAAKDESSNVDKLRDPVANINTTTEPPKNVSTARSSATPVRENVPFVVSDVTKYAAGTNDGAPERGSVGGNAAALTGKSETAQEIEKDIEPPPVLKTKPEPPAAVKKGTIVSKGVINGRAISLPKPVYPPAAKQIRVAGAVNVQVLIDENGNVVSANATSGHPLLRAAAAQAAKSARFTPTKLSNEPVKVTGIIVYNFVAQ